MSKGSEALSSAYAKLDWANSRHDQMYETFGRFALPDNPNDRPFGIEFQCLGRPVGLVVARFVVEREMPVEMSLLAADLVHNARVALDHTLARLKELFGGKSGQGWFPVCRTVETWDQRVVNGGKNRPLKGIEQTPAFDLVYDEQPMHRDDPDADPLAVLHGLDSDDKHQLMHRAFGYPEEKVRQGLDLIKVLDRKRVSGARNSWTFPSPLENGTVLATFMVRGGTSEPRALESADDVQIGYAIGPLGAPRVRFTDMIKRVRGIVDRAARLIDTES